MILDLDRATTEEAVEKSVASVPIGLSGLVEPHKMCEAHRIAKHGLAEIEIILTG